MVDIESKTLLSEILNNNNPDFDPESPQYLLWEEQKKQASYKSTKSMRWHPVMIRWCLSIQVSLYICIFRVLIHHQEYIFGLC